MSPMSDSKAKTSDEHMRVYLSSELLNEIEQQIEVGGESKSGWVRDAIRERLERDD